MLTSFAEKARKKFPWRFRKQDYTYNWLFSIDLGVVLEK